MNQNSFFNNRPISHLKLEKPSKHFLSNSEKNSGLLSTNNSLNNIEDSIKFETLQGENEELCKIELRIIEFLDENGIEMCSPSSKKIEFFEKSRANIILRSPKHTQSLENSGGLLFRRRTSVQFTPTINKCESEPNLNTFLDLPLKKKSNFFLNN